ncbi:unnamed protein product [Aphanomyces euteiches]
MEQLAGLAEIASASSFSKSGLTDQQVDESIDQLQQASDIWREGKRELLLEEQRWQEAADNSAKLQKLNKALEIKLDESKLKAAEAAADWQSWLIQNQLAKELSPASVLEIFQLIESGQQQLQQKQRNEAKFKVIDNRITDKLMRL